MLPDAPKCAACGKDILNASSSYHIEKNPPFEFYAAAGGSLDLWLCNDCAEDLCIDELFSWEHRMTKLVKDMYSMLQKYCDSCDCKGETGSCLMWAEKTSDCDLRRIERRMDNLGIELPYDDQADGKKVGNEAS